ncbi:hypothetical protein POM88_016454 [Heracleum sosnowskyi]|uniref:Uncharacterized protein n=1 Tax=Heracleum sosnowskyi TaxID=360622 RepID=A0AAD8MWY2_9APIA|nr:hypothetical protein POM88_016454 [Heracleum sosnowskyi]
MEGDKEGIRMATNQIHYKSLRNLVGEEYKDIFNKRSYVQVPGAIKSGRLEKRYEDDKGWQVVEYKKKKLVGSKDTHKKDDRTIFVAKIPLQARSKEVWSFFAKKREVVDIVLPKKIDKWGNRIGKDSEAKVPAVNLSNMNYGKVRPSKVNKGATGDSQLMENSKKPKGKGKMEEGVHQDMGDKVTPKEANNLKKATINGKMDLNLKYGLVGFSWFPVTGLILQEILMEEGIKNISIKEISCWKF